MKLKTPSFRKFGLISLFAIALGMTQPVYAQRVTINGTPDPIAPKDASVIDTKIGGQVRIIPTAEQDWDMGMSENLKKNKKKHLPAQPLDLLLMKGGSDSDPRMHSSESGRVSNEYIRTEARLTFEFIPQDKKWGLFMAVECDSNMDMEEVDGRCRNFGLERLNGMIDLPWIYSQFHAGWDLYAVDAVIKTEPTLSLGGAVSIYGDDDPGMWLQGEKGAFSWQLGWHKKVEYNETANAQTRGSAIDAFARNPDPVNYDPDRNIYDAGVTFKFFETKNLIKLMWVMDNMGYPSDEAAWATVKSKVPADQQAQVYKDHPESARVTSQYYGVLYHGSFFKDILSFVAEYATQTGDAKNTGITYDAEGQKDDYDIDADLLFFNVTSGVWGDAEKGIGGRLGLSYLRTSGDGKNDKKLEGFVGATAGQRFSQQIGTENSIIGEHNPLTLGNHLYGYTPEYFGSRGVLAKSGVVTGGLRAGLVTPPGDELTIGGRGDNPGLTMVNVRFDNRFNDNWAYRLQWRDIKYNEDFYPFLTAGRTINGKANQPVKDKNMGYEFGHELYYMFNWNTIVQFAYAQFTPGAGAEQVVKTYTGRKDTTPAKRTAIEIDWRF